MLLIDLNSKLKGDDVYILASQATQVYYAPSVKNPNSNIHTIITCRPQVLSGRAIDANMEPLQEDVSNTTPIEFSSRSLFVDFSIYEMEDEQEQQNEVESEEDEENEMEAGEDHEEEDDEEEEEEEDGYDSIEVDSGEEY